MSYQATGGGKAVVVVLFVVGVGLFGGILYMWANSASPGDRFPIRLKQSTFTCHDGGEEGVGFFVTESGYAVSSAKLFENDDDRKAMAVVGDNNEEIEVEIIDIDPSVDIAVLEFPAGKYVTVPVSQESSFMTGDPVLAVQYHNVVHGEISDVNPQSKTIRLDVSADEKVIGSPVAHVESQTIIGIVTSEVFQRSGGVFRSIALPEHIRNIVRDNTGIDIYDL
jgi:S1-C subfamily serine protease